MNLISTTYLLLFLPLIASISCYFFSKKFAPIFITGSCLALLIILATTIFPRISDSIKTINDGFALVPLALEFLANRFSINFILIILILKTVILFYYQADIKCFLNDKNHNLFYSVYLLQIFTIIGLFTSNNLINLFLFLELYFFSFFAIFSIANDKKVAQLLFHYFCLNQALSLILLFCFLIIYLNFNSLNIDEIKLLLIAEKDSRFFTVIAFFMAIVFLIKFFPLWLYFDNLKNNNLFANFFTANSLFIKANIGIFLLTKFSYLFFANIFLNAIFITIIIIIILYSLFCLLYTKHIKMAVIQLSIINFCFIFIGLIFNNKIAMQSMNYYWLHFNLINLSLFLFATFLQRQFGSSSFDKIATIDSNIGEVGNRALILPLKLLLIFVSCAPFSFMFYGHWYLISANLQFESGIINVLVIAAIIISMFVLLLFAIRILSLIDSNNEERNIIKSREYYFYLSFFWLMIFLIVIYQINSVLFIDL